MLTCFYNIQIKRTLLKFATGSVQHHNTVHQYKECNKQTPKECLSLPLSLSLSLSTSLRLTLLLQQVKPTTTSSPAVAQCLSVVSFNSTVWQVQASVISYFASYLLLCTNKFCSVLFGIFTDAWRSVP